MAAHIVLTADEREDNLYAEAFLMFQLKANIVLNKPMTQNCWRMVLDARKIAPKIKPGQFVMLKISETNDPLFRRPFSVFRRMTLDRGSSGVEIIYKVVGRGTQRMTDLKKGDPVDILGPLGHGFEWDRSKRIHVLVGGGTGSASLFMLGEEISKAKKRRKLELTVLLGAETKASLILGKEFKTLAGKLMVSTDDGAYGYQGSVTEMLEESLKKGHISPDCALYASGPEPMLKALTPICRRYEIPAQISMERHMMCGIGGCFVCVCKVDKQNVMRHRDLRSSHIQFASEEWGYALACQDGPVFHLDEVLFET